MKDILQNVARYYTGKIIQYGPTPHGVDWKNEESQFVRFNQLLKIISKNDDQFSLNDLGCGYGKLYELMKAANYRGFIYHGYDLSGEMIAQARNRCGNSDNPAFYLISAPNELQVADYTVASGIFNVRIEHAVDEWLEYVLQILGHMDRCSKRGFAFNCLTIYSDEEYMKDSLFYADPCLFFDYCKNHFSKNVALLHDYDLYEFTVLVRKG